MGMPRYAARRDLSEPEIVSALERVGCKVYRHLPCDLLVRLPQDPPGVLRSIECKTPQGGKGTTRIDKRQREQIQFIEDTGTPRLSSWQAVFHWLGL